MLIKYGNLVLRLQLTQSTKNNLHVAISILLQNQTYICGSHLLPSGAHQAGFWYPNDGVITSAVPFIGTRALCQIQIFVQRCTMYVVVDVFALESWCLGNAFDDISLKQYRKKNSIPLCVGLCKGIEDNSVMLLCWPIFWKSSYY